MKASEVEVGGYYVAKVSNRETVVKVDAVRERSNYNGRSQTVYDVTNTATGRTTTFRSAAKFRRRTERPAGV